MVKILDNKHIFWQAFLLASIVFWIGLLLGISFEKSRINEIEGFYFDSETDLFDFELSTELVYGSNSSCDILYGESVVFAEKIFKEASKLEKYDDSNKITKELISLHRRYDLLRILLWQDIAKINQQCENKVNIVVYLYQYIDPSLTTKATQGAMSNSLIELKQKYKNQIILIPIAVDTNVASLDFLRKKYGLEIIPTIFVNDEHEFNSLEEISNIESILYNSSDLE